MPKYLIKGFIHRRMSEDVERVIEANSREEADEKFHQLTIDILESEGHDMHSYSEIWDSREIMEENKNA